MQVARIAEGLWRWSAYYEEWREDVGCVYYEAPDAVVLIDPLVSGRRSTVTFGVRTRRYTSW
jgi:hypothetical protein